MIDLSLLVKTNKTCEICGGSFYETMVDSWRLDFNGLIHWKALSKVFQTLDMAIWTYIVLWACII